MANSLLRSEQVEWRQGDVCRHYLVTQLSMLADLDRSEYLEEARLWYEQERGVAAAQVLSDFTAQDGANAQVRARRARLFLELKTLAEYAAIRASTHSFTERNGAGVAEEHWIGSEWGSYADYIENTPPDLAAQLAVAVQRLNPGLWPEPESEAKKNAVSSAPSSSTR